jgi:leucyl-tRNA synthetase
MDKKEIEDYVKNARSKSDLERTELSKEKTGVFSGLYAINPATDKEIPIWISDFVLSSYGTGAIMSVPAHDERDNAFAKKFNIEIEQVLVPVFKITEGKDAVRDDKPTVKRNTAYSFLKHWSENKYLCLDWKQFGWHSGIIGGVNDSEDWVEAAKREIKEETGYINIELEKEIGVEVHNNFFAGHKDENRYAVGQGFVFRLKNDERIETKEEDTKNHNLVWIEGKEMDKFLNLPVFNFYWDIYNSGKTVFEDDGILINSEFLNGLNKNEAVEKMVKWLQEKGIGEKTASYHLRDWIFSRQHYWGEPIPMVNCPEHGWVPVPEDQLPIVLPEVENYEPTDNGESPLSTIPGWVDTVCPICGKPAKKETDTMPNWAGSDWYYLRYIDPFNDTVIADKNKMKYWLPIDVYIGGDEHNTLHLLYSRFIYKFLWDLGVVPKEHPEPYYKRLSHGVILGPDNQRMSKSRGNVIVPEEVSQKYGVDVVRMYLMFMGPFDATMAWNENTLMGVKRFLDRFNKYINDQVNNNTASSDEVKVLINKLVKGVTDDLSSFKFNTAIAKMMEGLNGLSNSKVEEEEIKTLIKLIAPLAPYTAEELWSLVKKNENESVHIIDWPKADPKYLVEETISIAVAINGKVRDIFEVESSKSKVESRKEIIEAAKRLEKISKWIEGKDIVKEIYVPGKMVNLVVN